MFTLFGIFNLVLGLSGTFLFLVSLSIEGYVFTSLLNSALIGFALATALELSKLVSVIGGPLLIHIGTKIGLSMRLLILFLRAGLITVSVCCSIVFLALHVDKPAFLSVRANDIDRLKANEAAELAALNTHYQQQLKELNENFDNKLKQREASIEGRHQPHTSELEVLLVEEMNNVVKGQFIGPRYKEFQRRLEAKKENLELAINDMQSELENQKSEQELSIHSSYQSEKVAIQDSFYAQISQVESDDYSNDDRVSLPIVRAARNLIDGAFNIRISDLAIGMVLSILISSVGEIALLFMLALFTKLCSSILIAQYDLWQHKNVHQLNTHSDFVKLRTKSVRDAQKIQDERQKIERRAESYLQSSK